MIFSVVKAELSSIKEDLQVFRKSICFISSGYDETKMLVDMLVSDNIM